MRKKVATSFLTGFLGLLGLALVWQPHPTEASSTRVEECQASWYGPGFQGRTMANGETFDTNIAETVAHKELPFETKVRITNLKNGRVLYGVVRDRGPFHAGRCVDLSHAGATQLDFIEAGTTKVRVEVVRS